MSLIEKISKLFGKGNKKAISAAPIAAVEEEFMRTQEKLQPLYTFYTIGPDYITWRYPVDMTPLKEFTDFLGLYFTLLHHNEGIAIKYLSDYKDELQAWYNALSNRKDTKQSIETLIDPTNNSANEKLSRIRKAFESALENYEDALDDFIPVGKKTQPYIINSLAPASSGNRKV